MVSFTCERGIKRGRGSLQQGVHGWMHTAQLWLGTRRMAAAAMWVGRCCRQAAWFHLQPRPRDALVAMRQAQHAWASRTLCVLPSASCSMLQ